MQRPMGESTTAKGWRAAVRRRIPGVTGLVLLAVLVDFVLDSLLNGVGSVRLRFGTRLVAFLVGALVAFLLGMFFGGVVWPRAGRRFSAYLLRRTMQGAHAPRVFLTDHADFDISVARRMLEVVGLVAGATVIVDVSLTFLGVATGTVNALSGTFTFVAFVAAFLLVPYWVFGRMGLRQVDRKRWLVQPLGRRYAQRLRLSNGALLLVAFGAIVNIAIRAGSTANVAIQDGVILVGRSIAVVLVTAASAVGYYLRVEHDLMVDLEGEAIRDGVLDARGMTDDEFLPRAHTRERS